MAAASSTTARSSAYAATEQRSPYTSTKLRHHRLTKTTSLDGRQKYDIACQSDRYRQRRDEMTERMTKGVLQPEWRDDGGTAHGRCNTWPTPSLHIANLPLDANVQFR